MFLRNYDNIVSAITLPNFSDYSRTSPSSYFQDGSFALRDQSGTIYKNVLTNCFPLSRINDTQPTSGWAPSDGSTMLLLGSGDIPVTYDDYMLANVLDTTYFTKCTLVVWACGYSQTTQKFSRKFSLTTSALKAVTIKEYGWLSGVKTSTSSGSDKQFLVFREVLSEPITLQAGQNIKFTFNISSSANGSRPEISLI